jgi:hypothetical protein
MRKRSGRELIGIAWIFALGAGLSASCAEGRDITVVNIDSGASDSPADVISEGLGDGPLEDSNPDSPIDASSDAVADAGDAGEDAAVDAPIDSSPDALPAIGLALFLKLEDTSGTEFDYSGNNNFGTVSGAVQRGVPGKDGLAFDLSGDGKVVAKSSPTLDMTSGGTIELWVKLSSFTAGSIVARGTGNNDNSVRIKTAQGNVQVLFTRAGGGSANLTSATDVLPTGQWKHVAATNDGATLKLFIDGTLHTSVTGGQMGSQFADLHVGKSAGADNAFSGSIDELRWWTVARTDAEVCQDAGGTTATVDGATVCSIP